MPKWRKFLLSGHSGSAPIHFIDRERLIVVGWMSFIKLRVALKSIQWHNRRDFKSNCQEPMAIRLAIQWSTLKCFEQPIGGFKTGQCKIFIANGNKTIVPFKVFWTANRSLKNRPMQNFHRQLLFTEHGLCISQL